MREMRARMYTESWSFAGGLTLYFLTLTTLTFLNHLERSKRKRIGKELVS